MRALVALLMGICLPADSLNVARRAAVAGGTAAAVASVLAPVRSASALFESEPQLAVIAIATVQPKLRGLVTDTAEMKRKRVKMAAESSDDAYVFRFARSVLDPVTSSMATAAPALQDPARAAALSDEFSSALAALYAGCRAVDASAENAAAVRAEAAVSEFLQMAESTKKGRFDVAPRDDINGFEGATGILYNKFLFRSG